MWNVECAMWNAEMSAHNSLISTKLPPHSSWFLHPPLLYQTFIFFFKLSHLTLLINNNIFLFFFSFSYPSHSSPTYLFRATSFISSSFFLPIIPQRKKGELMLTRAEGDWCYYRCVFFAGAGDDNTLASVVSTGRRRLKKGIGQSHQL